jgi:nitrate reductase NapE component
LRRGAACVRLRGERDASGSRRMEGFATHIQDNWIAYAILVVCLVPVLYVFRDYTRPLIFHSFEVAIYMAIFHVVFHGGVRMAAWFRYESSFDKSITVDWTTPLIVGFWRQELYNPLWLYWAELAVLGLFIFIVWRFRPMKLGDRNTYRSNKVLPQGKPSPQYTRARGAGRRR